MRYITLPGILSCEDALFRLEPPDAFPRARGPRTRPEGMDESFIAWASLRGDDDRGGRHRLHARGPREDAPPRAPRDGGARAEPPRAGVQGGPRGAEAARAVPLRHAW